MKLKKYNFCRLLILATILFLSLCPGSKAVEINDAKAFFENYVRLCHSYDRAVLDQYSDDALIKRTLLYPSGKTEVVVLATDDYKSKLKYYRYLAVITRYRNNYYDLKYVQEGKNVRLTGDRQVVSENYRTPVNYLIGKDKTNRTVILEEILQTKGIHFFKKKSG